MESHAVLSAVVVRSPFISPKNLQSLQIALKSQQVIGSVSMRIACISVTGHSCVVVSMA